MVSCVFISTSFDLALGFYIWICLNDALQKVIANCKKSDCISDLKLKTPGDSRLEQSITL
ncbi:hypothetical protein MYEC719_p30012 (plasmid) [Escherichia coli]|nr:hypothetical protein MYEC719_p30012 [Escherichia coli]